MATRLEVLGQLEQMIAARMADFAAGRLSAEDSRVIKALAGPPEELLRKLPEEAVEVVLAVTHRGNLTAEAADLLFFLLLILHQQQVPFDDVLDELARRMPAAESAASDK